MDIEKLIDGLKNSKGPDNCHDCALGYWALMGATALSTLQAENKRLNKIVCSIPTTPDSGRTVSQYDKEMSMCAYLDDLEAENEGLRADLEQAKAERDAAISDLETIMAYGGGNLDTCQFCKNGQCYVRGGTKSCLPKWRGQKEE